MIVDTKAVIENIFDSGTFKESMNDFEGGSNVIVGKGLLNGRPTYLIADYPGGWKPVDWSARWRKKAVFIRKTILKTPHPVVVLFDWGLPIAAGSRFTIPPGMKKTCLGKDTVGGYFAEFPMLAGVVPTVGIVVGNMAAGSALSTGFCDALILVRGSNVSLARAEAVESLTGEKVDIENLSGPEMHCRVSGVADAVADSPEAAAQWARRFLSFMPQCFREEPPEAKARGRVAELSEENENLFAGKLAFDVRGAIRELADDGELLELREFFAQEVVTGFIRIAGKPVGIIANNSIKGAGAIYPETCKKLAKFISICDAFSLRLVFLADTPGFMIGPEVEHAGVIKLGCAVLSSLAWAEVPKIFVTVRKAYGGAVQIMGGPGYADHIVALPKTIFGPYGMKVIKEATTKEESQAMQELVDLTDIPGLVDDGFVDECVPWRRMKVRLDELLREKRAKPRAQPKRYFGL